ncbi:glutamate racemase [Agrilactobacillus fermenti]|uniref:glutamate racemase n=1 Tax=Agrilactobacillus fermenti TaxID=2586909 RepID=UPI0022A8DA2E|nr:glutamate racemase [Agrilactobacillus fermenti]
MNKQPIGFLDSGVGGLTVVKEAMRQLPHEKIIFIGDQARIPYGPRPQQQVIEFTKELTQFLLKKQIKMLVIACNTATAEALSTIKPQLDIPVVGVILPGSRAAIKATKDQHIGIIGTEGTVKSGAYARVIQSKNKHIQVFSIAAPKFVPLVESNEYRSVLAKKVVAETLEPFKQHPVDTLVMGCTHYPLLRPLIQNVMGPRVKLIDPGAETASEVSTLLDYFDIANDDQEYQPVHEFYTTGSTKMFAEIAGDWLNMPDIKPQHVALQAIKLNQVGVES